MRDAWLLYRHPAALRARRRAFGPAVVHSPRIARAIFCVRVAVMRLAGSTVLLLALALAGCQGALRSVRPAAPPIRHGGGGLSDHGGAQGDQVPNREQPPGRPRARPSGRRRSAARMEFGVPLLPLGVRRADVAVRERRRDRAIVEEEAAKAPGDYCGVLRRQRQGPRRHLPLEVESPRPRGRDSAQSDRASPRVGTVA